MQEEVGAGGLVDEMREVQAEGRRINYFHYGTNTPGIDFSSGHLKSLVKKVSSSLVYKWIIIFFERLIYLIHNKKWPELGSETTFAWYLGDFPN